MIPKSLSASAISVANLCLARYEAENIDYARGPAGQYALLGTSVHNALELYVKACYLERTQEPSLSLLVDLFHLTYMQTFGTGETDSEEFKDGLTMLKAWFKRTDFDLFGVISCEIKENFPVKTSAGVIPFNYIWDRHDRIEDGVVRVVDYKTNRWGYSPADLKKLPQARAYGLAAMFKYPDAERIWVEFDMLRHDGPVGVVFTPDECRDTYKWIKREAERIIDTPKGKAPETVNANCNFCVRKTNCGAFKKNAAAGGVLAFANAQEAIARRAELEYVKKGVERALDELDSFIIAESKALDVFEWENDTAVMEIVVKSRREIDPTMASMVLGDEIMKKYGGIKLTIGAVDKLLKGTEISDEKKKQLRGLIFSTPNNPSISVKPKSQFEE